MFFNKERNDHQNVYTTDNFIGYPKAKNTHGLLKLKHEFYIFLLQKKKKVTCFKFTGLFSDDKCAAQQIRRNKHIHTLSALWGRRANLPENGTKIIFLTNFCYGEGIMKDGRLEYF